VSYRSLKEVIVSSDQTIKNVMRNIDYSGLRVAYVVDKDNKLLGAVSDSEIRRSILKGRNIKDSVKDIINPNPVVLKKDELSDPVIIKKMIRRLHKRMPDSRYILVVDHQKRPQSIKYCPKLLDKEDKPIRKQPPSTVKCVLVVGGAGYLGSVLVRKLLKLGYKVKILDILLFGIESIKDVLLHKNFEFIEGDMRNISVLVNALENVDAVINLAAIVGDPACVNKPEMTIETNYLSNKALAEACKYHQISFNKFKIFM